LCLFFFYCGEAGGCLDGSWGHWRRKGQK
jgi:hypothetical protein